ncbi:hypothetical protein L1887_43436 [Cichorium endivia]|nr:hypothetical protein L1887_43436 [Cichorium endivia]
MLSASRTWIGVVVAVAGNVTISLALNCQKLAHTRLQHAHQGHPDSNHASTNDADGHAAEGSASSSSEDVQSQGEHSPSTHRHHNSDQDDSRNTQNGNQKLHKDRGDQIGHNGNGKGNDNGNGNGNGNGMDTMRGNFISYGFAPASLVAPLGAVALLSNVIISPILLGERFKPSDIGGILLAIIGCSDGGVQLQAERRPARPHAAVAGDQAARIRHLLGGLGLVRRAARLPQHHISRRSLGADRRGDVCDLRRLHCALYERHLVAHLGWAADRSAQIPHHIHARARARSDSSGADHLPQSCAAAIRQPRSDPGAVCLFHHLGHRRLGDPVSRL